ncbi:hypothetical protein VP01_5313g1 [Puccinia sorghi]|uniref:Uncharacterized protein n=1 Tax=Puccinia sorghi TaxID=27349 RepID=A0A0L6UK76_9BASI|nr:hypothetical protein VP01_5313g1 [Puccinia sorghi]
MSKVLFYLPPWMRKSTFVLLKQAPKNWFKTLTSWFEEINYCPSEFEEILLSRFPNSTAHLPDTLLGMNLNISSDAIELSRPGLIKKGLEMLDLTHCRPFKTPLTLAVQLHSATEEDHQVSHWCEVLHCWKFLKGTQDLGLLLRPDKKKHLDFLNFFTNATWRTTNQESLEVVCLLSGSPVQSCGTKVKLAPTFFQYIYKKGLLENLKNFGSNSKTKHLDIKIKSFRKKFKNKDIDVKLISSNNMIADSLTKAAAYSSIKKLQSKCLSFFTNNQGGLLISWLTVLNCPLRTSDS